jgi:hypothetical protein
MRTALLLTILLAQIGGTPSPLLQREGSLLAGAWRIAWSDHDATVCRRDGSGCWSLYEDSDGSTDARPDISESRIVAVVGTLVTIRTHEECMLCAPAYSGISFYTTDIAKPGALLTLQDIFGRDTLNSLSWPTAASTEDCPRVAPTPSFSSFVVTDYGGGRARVLLRESTPRLALPVCGAFTEYVLSIPVAKARRAAFSSAATQHTLLGRAWFHQN